MRSVILNQNRDRVVWIEPVWTQPVSFGTPVNTCTVYMDSSPITVVLAIVFSSQNSVDFPLPRATVADLFFCFFCQNITYNVQSKFRMQQAGQTGGCTALMSALNPD